MLGHGSIAALFNARSHVEYNTYIQSVDDFAKATIEEVEYAMSLASFDPSTLDLDTCNGHWSGEGLEQTLCSLNALRFASRIYTSIPDSTVSIEVIAHPIHTTSWASSLMGNFKLPPVPPEQGMWFHVDTERQDRSTATYVGPHHQYDEMDTAGRYRSSPSDTSSMSSDSRLSGSDAFYAANDVSSEDIAQKEGIDITLKQSFACLAWFESGEFDIPVAQMNAVMALVNGDSIYVASGLLMDPSMDSRRAPIQRVFGSLGRSEMCLLAPPADPRLADPALSSWEQINHIDFDGQFQDNFRSTSLHLTFTESEDAVYLGNRGLRDCQAVFLEALVFIDDRGRNIGDLDILSMFNNPTFSVMQPCVHSKEKREDFSGALKLTAVDCWEEFLDPPEGATIFRASGNWQARLGASAAATKKGREVLVLPSQACLRCLQSVELAPTCIVIS
jgi:hypothetical protein